MQFTTVRSKEKDYDIYLKSVIQKWKNWFHEKNRGTKKMFPIYLEVEKKFLSIFLFGERKKWIPAIWRPKNVVHNSQEQGKRL